MIAALTVVYENLSDEEKLAIINNSHVARLKIGCVIAELRRSTDLLRQALEALDSDNPDIQLRSAIAIREHLEKS